MDVDEFAPYLRKNLLLAGIDTKEFDRSMILAGKESDEITEKMQKNSRE